MPSANSASRSADNFTGSSVLCGLSGFLEENKDKNNGKDTATGLAICMKLESNKIGLKHANSNIIAVHAPRSGWNTK